jgi:prepilin-type N-terminal cleavage/methylation domain-containing protein
MTHNSIIHRSKPDKPPVRGFTLIEILLVCVIIGIMAAVLVPSLMGRGGHDAGGNRILSPKERAHAVGTVSYVDQINQAILMYRQDHDDQNPPDLKALKPYGVMDEMIVDQVTHQPLPYDPATGRIGNLAGPYSMGGGAHGRLPVFEGTPAAPTGGASADGDN